ncbi:MAG: phosphoribosylanthranilate isomerase [Burkholderiaceae bacterium]
MGCIWRRSITTLDGNCRTDRGRSTFRVDATAAGALHTDAAGLQYGPPAIRRRPCGGSPSNLPFLRIRTFVNDMNRRTRVKICGLTRPQDVAAAADAGADAVGFVFYPPSPRNVDAGGAAALMTKLPPFVTGVGLFVNADADDVAAIVERAPLGLLQFHGDETPADCARIAERVRRPFLKAVRIRPETRGSDLLELERDCRSASAWFAGLLLDAFVEGYGGSGKGFDWSVIPEDLAPRVVLSGGLTVQNAAEAVSRVRPLGLDVSSGVESAKGIKDAAKIQAFIGEVVRADHAAGFAANHR